MVPPYIVRSAWLRLSGVLLVMQLLGCGADNNGLPVELTAGAWELRPPVVDLASPTKIAVGEEVVILGRDFVPPLHGQPFVVFNGTFHDRLGQPYPVNDLRFAARYQNQAKVTWWLWPDVVFHPEGRQLGTFVGELKVINQVGASEAASQPIAVRFEIKPSLIPVVMRPLEAGCGNIVTKTLEDKPFEFTLEAVGLFPGTEDNPLIFRWTFAREHWYVRMHGRMFDAIETDASLRIGAVTLRDDVINGSRSVMRDGGRGDVLLSIADTVWGRDRLHQLKTALVPQKQDSEREEFAAQQDFDALVAVTAVDSAGVSAHITIPIHVTRGATMDRDSSMDRVVKREAPEMITSCIPGGNLPRSVSYRESHSVHRSRDVGFSLNANIGTGLGFIRNINFNGGFGMDVRASLSSSNELGRDISSELLPGEYAVFYRQIEQVERIGQLTLHYDCGGSQYVGTVKVKDWNFAGEVATGPQCPPETHFLPAGDCVDNCTVQQHNPELSGTVH